MCSRSTASAFLRVPGELLGRLGVRDNDTLKGHRGIVR